MAVLPVDFIALLLGPVVLISEAGSAYCGCLDLVLLGAPLLPAPILIIIQHVVTKYLLCLYLFIDVVAATNLGQAPLALQFILSITIYETITVFGLILHHLQRALHVPRGMYVATDDS